MATKLKWRLCVSKDGEDCCRACPFNGEGNGNNGFRKGQSDLFCEIRRFVIFEPSKTYCNNHPLRNPLWIQKARGPIWAAIHISFDSKPLRGDIKLPAEVVPPQGEGNYFRIPYYGLVRPARGEAGVCVVCGEAREESIMLLLERDKKFFCSAAHYFEWWLQTDPRGVTYQKRIPLGKNAVNGRFKAVPEKLAQGLSVLEDGEKEWLIEALMEVDELLLELRNGKIELMHDYLEKEDQEFDLPRFWENLSYYLQEIQSELTIVGDLLRHAELDYQEVSRSVNNITKAVGGYLRQEWRN